MRKKFIALFLCIFLTLGLTACGDSSKQAAPPPDAKLKVIVSFDAMSEFVKAVGKDKVDVSTIIPDGTEPHEFELKTEDLKNLSDARVFVYNGLGMEPWAADAAKASNNSNLISVEASKGIEGIQNTDPDEIKEHGQYDPHSWISLKNAEVEVKNIKDALVKADPGNKDFYEQNCSEYVAELDKLYDEYNAKFQSASQKQFVTGHAAFAYLCRDFRLEQNSVEDAFAEGEPSAQQLAELVKYCKEHNIKTIFAEKMVSPQVSETLANEVGAKVETIYTMESHEDNKPYLERARDNLEKIYASLQQ